jgi:hypothetical protein
MRQLSRLIPPHPTDPIARAALQRLAEGDVATQLLAKQVKERFPSFMLTRLRGGSGFPMSKVIRSYLQEYTNRLMSHGPDSFPTSFNVVEGFLKFSPFYFVFDLREEREHLVRLYAFLDWYTAGKFLDDPRVLVDVLPEGIVYAYNMVAPADDFRVQTENSELVTVGLAMVRHSTELSIVGLFGEHPANPPDDEIPPQAEGRPVKGREWLRADESLSLKDRYLDEAPKFVRVIALARFDLSARRFDVKSVNIDVGRSYHVFTDDPMVTRGLDPSERAKWVQATKEGLGRYEAVFGLLSTALYLPAFFISEQEHVTTTTFATELRADRSSKEVKTALQLLTPSEVPLMRNVNCFTGEMPPSGDESRTVEPPEVGYTSSGYWRSLSPAEVGEDPDGHPIVGKTWVERTDMWPVKSVDRFVVSKRPPSAEGPDPGTIYVMRSQSHGHDIYKVGLTRVDVTGRSAQLSSATGVPERFEVLSEWRVGDVADMERRVHERLAYCRVSLRREFFRAPLSDIIKAIESEIQR